MLTNNDRRSVLVLAFLCAFNVPAGIASAQTGNRSRHPSLADSSVSVFMRYARQGHLASDVAVEILRQGTQSYPDEKRRALADSLASLAIGLNGPAISAVGAIKQWGGADSRLDGQADAAALNYLIRIAREARDPETRMGAIRGMTTQINPSRAVPYLSELAVSTRGEDAFAAVTALNRLAFGGSAGDGSAAVQALRRLYDTASLKSGAAISILCGISASQGWPRSPICAGRA